MFNLFKKRNSKNPSIVEWYEKQFEVEYPEIIRINYEELLLKESFPMINIEIGDYVTFGFFNLKEGFIEYKSKYENSNKFKSGNGGDPLFIQRTIYEKTSQKVLPIFQSTWVSSWYLVLPENGEYLSFYDLERNPKKLVNTFIRPSQIFEEYKDLNLRIKEENSSRMDFCINDSFVEKYEESKYLAWEDDGFFDVSTINNYLNNLFSKFERLNGLKVLKKEEKGNLFRFEIEGFNKNTDIEFSFLNGNLDTRFIKEINKIWFKDGYEKLMQVYDRRGFPEAVIVAIGNESENSNFIIKGWTKENYFE